MSRPSVKSSLYLQQDSRQQRPEQGRVSITRPLQPEGSTVTLDDLAQILRSNVGDDEEHVDLFAELENLFGYYGRMN